MKTQLLLLGLCGLVIVAVAHADREPVDVSDRPVTRTPLPAKFFPHHHAQRVRIAYAPVTVPPMSEDDGMLSFFQSSTPLPCVDCLVTWLQMDLEYLNGTRADAATDMWLHHGILANRAREDAVCGPDAYAERTFASGNERTAIDMTANGAIKAGYYLGSTDQMALSVDLMNMRHSQAQEDVVFTITYEFIPKRHGRRHFATLTPHWLDVGGCGPSEMPAHDHAAFELVSEPFVSFTVGTIAFVGGHLHDGGTHIDLVRDGQVVCSLQAHYTQYAIAHGVGDRPEHVSSIESCSTPMHTATGESWVVKAYYNTSMHAPMARMDGSLEPVMGIMLVYVAADPPQRRPSEGKWLNLTLALVCLGAIAGLHVGWKRLKRNQEPQVPRWQCRGRIRRRPDEVDVEEKAPLMDT